MRRVFTKGRCVGLLALLLLAAGGGAAWVYRAELSCWYYLRGLATASKEDRDGWIERLAELDTAAVPGLLDQLSSANVQTCANAEAALSHLAQQWGEEDQRAADLARDMAGRFASFSVPGQEAALEWQLARLAAVP